MHLAGRSITAFAVIGALGLFAAGCSADGDEPAPSTTRSATAAASSSATASATPDDDGSPDGDASTTPDDDTPGAFPGTGSTPDPDTDPSAFPATAVVTFAGWDDGSRTLQASGLVSGTTDTSGKCTFVAEKGGISRTLTSTAQASASSVNCAQVSFPATQVSSGTWSITLEYTVGSASTTSDPMTAEVP